LASILACILKHGSATSVEIGTVCDTDIETDSKASLLVQAHRWKREGSVSPTRTQAIFAAQDAKLSSRESYLRGRRKDRIAQFFTMGVTSAGASIDKNPGTDELEAHLKAKFGSLEGVEGHTEDVGPLENQTDRYDQWAKSGIISICETGFNAGHSALRFLSQNAAQVYSFDIGSAYYANESANFLKSKYPNRLMVTWGDSTKTLPKFREEYPDVGCDLMVVDGGHSNEIAKSDLLNFALMAKPNAIIAIDDTPCGSSMCEGIGKAWDELVQHGCIKTTEAITLTGTRGFTYGKYTQCSLVSEFGHRREVRESGVAQPAQVTVGDLEAHLKAKFGSLEGVEGHTEDVGPLKNRQICMTSEPRVE
jgi:hypothetical protein